MKDNSRVKREIYIWRISQGLKDKSANEGKVKGYRRNLQMKDKSRVKREINKGRISQGLKEKSTNEG